MRSLRADVSLSAAAAGVIAVLVGFTSSVVIVFSAAQALGATPAQTTSWIWALGLGMGLSSLGLSLHYRQPVLTAWSTPGAALRATAVLVSAASGALPWSRVDWQWALPAWTAPVFSLGAIVSVGLPLFIVTMASQNLPGVAAMRACGYRTPVSPVITTTGLFSLLLAPFGAFALNLAAITAAICMGREAHEDPGRRYVAALAAGVFYIALGLAGGAVVGLLGAFAREAVVALAGLALLGIGSAFWGVVAGSAALMVQHYRSRAHR